MQTTFAPRPPARFWDRIAPKYAAQPVADPAAYEDKLVRVASLLRARDRVLEVGCGTGSTALRLAPGVADYTATDISSGMIAIARDKARADDRGNLNFLQAEAGDDLDGSTFDVVMAFSLLHLVDDLPRTLASLHQRVGPGGLFLTKTVCLGDAPWVVRAFVRVLGLIGIAPPILHLTEVELRWAMIDAGFEIVERRYFGKGRVNPFIVARRPN